MSTSGSVGVGVDGAPSVAITTGTAGEVRLGAGSLLGGRGGPSVIFRAGAPVAGVLGPRGKSSTLLNVVGRLVQGGVFDVVEGPEEVEVHGMCVGGSDQLWDTLDGVVDSLKPIDGVGVVGAGF